MKTKSIIFSGLLLALLGAATTSCEDMLNVEDELHTQNLSPQDTVYQMFGIINRIQSLADRIVVLGELRADLIEVDPDVAKTSLQDVMNNNITTANEYNQVSDYYAVINSCNTYLAYVDSTFVAHNKLLFEREIQAVKTFRAWTYLELAKVYGRVPFVLEPVLSSATADDIVASTTNRVDMGQICDYFIEDLLPYASKYIETPNFGTVNSFNSTLFFIPTRLMLAELYLWRGSFNQSQDDYLQACRYYHDYFSYPNQTITTGTASTKWGNAMFNGNPSDSYSGSFNNDAVTIIPLDTCAYDGTWSQLYAIFNSQFENNYFVPVYPSERIREISRDQVYCYYSFVNLRRDTIYSTQKQEWEDSLLKGDLRLGAVYDRSYVSNMYTDIYSYQRQHIMKFATSTSNNGPDQKLRRLNLFRKNIIWLHFAEALNRAGFPETAFVILKYGLDQYSIRQYVSEKEIARLNEVPTFFRGSLGSWSDLDFVSEISPRANDGTGSRVNQQGIHSRGSGDSRYNDYYALPIDSALWAEADSLLQIYSYIRTGQNVFQQLYGTRVDVVKDTIYDVYYLPNNNGGTDTLYNYETTYSYFYYEYSDSLLSLNDVLSNSSELVDSVLRTFFAGVDSMRMDDIAKELRRLENQYNDLYTAAEDVAYDHDFPIWQEALHQMILDEEALEGMFEGYRFYDLMRYAMYKGDKDYIAREVAKRKGLEEHDERADALLGGNWYLPLPKR